MLAAELIIFPDLSRHFFLRRATEKQGGADGGSHWEISWFGLNSVHVFKCLGLLREALYHRAKFRRSMCNGKEIYNEQTNTHSSFDSEADIYATSLKWTTIK
jgi:hypothetical protein